MNTKELDYFLKKETESEYWHQENPHILSSNYQRINKTMIDNQSVYIFKFNKIIRNGKFAIQKESRFTQVPLHRHTTIEMNYVYSGEAHYQVNGKELILKKGDICILDTNVVHLLRYLEEDSIVMNIEMRPEYFSASFFTQLMGGGVVASFLLNAINEQKNSQNYLIFKTESNTKFRDTILSLFCEYFDPQTCTEAILAANMIIIFSLLVRLYKTRPSNEHSTLSEEIIEILEYLDDNYQHATLTSLANKFNYHPNYISALLKKSLGKSFRELKLDIQMQRALTLVQNTRIPIYEIATEIGFSNMGQFYRKFVEYQGIKPNQLRKQTHSNI